MNKIILSTVIACGLLLLDAPEAAAHEARYEQHRSTPYYSYDRGAYRHDGYRKGHRRDYRHDYYGSRYERVHKMPRWLKHDRAFRHWFKHSRLRRNRYVSWNELFDIYRWEYAYSRYYRY